MMNTVSSNPVASLLDHDENELNTVQLHVNLHGMWDIQLFRKDYGRKTTTILSIFARQMSLVEIFQFGIKL